MYRILIVSEDAFLRNMVAHSLSDLGAELRSAAGTEQMQQMCSRSLYDLVIVLDVGVLLDGRDMMRRLRPEGIRRPQFYVVSWQQSEHTVMSLLESGADQYLTFPVSLQRLRRKVVTDLERAYGASV